MAKGADYEREIAKLLSLWWTQDLASPRDDIFWRSSTSGARATTRAKRGKTTAGGNGDLTNIDPSGQPLIDKFIIEIKRGYSSDIQLLSMLDGKLSKKHTLLEFWRQAERDRLVCSRQYSLVIFKRDRMRPCIMFTQDLQRRLQRYCGGFVCDKITFTSAEYQLTLLPLQSFLDIVTPNIITSYL